MASYDWRLEMENMLAAFNRQAIHSLGIIKLAFSRSGLTFTPEFKKHFVQASTNRIIETYDQFEINSMLQEQLGPNLNSVANLPKISPRNGSNGVECVTDDRGNADGNDWRTNAPNSFVQIDDFDDGFLIETVETNPSNDGVENSTPSDTNVYEVGNDMVSTQSSSGTYISNDSLAANEELDETDTESVAHQSNTNQVHIINAEASDDVNFDVEMDESNDSIEMVDNQNDSTDADDKKLIPMNVVLNRLDETTSSKLTKGKSKATRLNRKKRITTTTGTRVDCARVAIKGEKRKRTHTGGNQHQCDRCGRSFTGATGLMKHVTTHIAEFPFHCRVCFHGFALKDEAKAHEIYCQKRRFECYLCKKFVTCDKADLIRHMRKHTGVKPFRCEICNMNFVQKENLKRHLNNIHA